MIEKDAHVRKNWKTILMTSVAGLALTSGFFAYNQKTEQKLGVSALIEGIVNVPETETQEERNTISNALIEAAETTTGRKLLEQMYGHYGTNDQIRINVVMEDIGLTTGRRSENHKIALNTAYLPGGASECLPYTDIRITAAHEVLHELQAQERGVDTIGHTYEDDFREDKLKEAEAKLQNIVIGSEIQDSESSLSPLYSYLTNKLESRFSQNESERIVKTSFFQCLWQNKGIETAIVSCIGNNISAADLNKMGINLKKCNEEIQEWNTNYNKQAIKNAYLNDPLRANIPGVAVSYQATEEQQKSIYQSYVTRLNKNGIAISLEDIQKGFDVTYQDDSNLFSEGVVIITDSLGQHTFESSDDPTKIKSVYKERTHNPNSKLLQILAQNSEVDLECGVSAVQDLPETNQKGVFQKVLSVEQQAALNAKKLQH